MYIIYSVHTNERKLSIVSKKKKPFSPSPRQGRDNNVFIRVTLLAMQFLIYRDVFLRFLAIFIQSNVLLYWDHPTTRRIEYWFKSFNYNKGWAQNLSHKI